MSGTRRIPILRRPGPSITPRALELFKALEKAERARRKSVRCVISEYGYCVTDTCPSCQQWSELHNLLHIELGLRPWQWPCLPRNPFPPDAPAAREWRPGTEQQALWELLDAARRELQTA